MRIKIFMAAVVVAALGCCAGRLSAQVAPAARVGGYPIGIGFGISRYYLDYGPGRYMEGPTARVSVGLFHGLGVDVSARSIFMNTPTRLTRMEQNTFLAGAYYDGIHFGRLRPFVRGAGGIGTIEFPSRNPNYTRDSYTVYAPAAGAEYLLTPQVALRGEYEYEFWKDYQGPHYLNPQGWTVGATYYLRPRRMHEHRD